MISPMKLRQEPEDFIVREEATFTLDPQGRLSELWRQR